MGKRQDAILMLEQVTGQKCSDEQRKVLEATGGKCILASAGSGKTTVLTWDLAIDIMTDEVDATKLLCTTYSKAGAGEMNERIAALFKKLGLYQKVEVRTMHSTYYKVLRDFGIVKQVITQGQRSMYIREACKEAHIQLEDEDLDTMDSLLSYQVNNLLNDKQLYQSYVFTLNNVSIEQYAAVRTGYSARKQANGFIDFDDMQLYMYMLCVQQRNPDVLNYCRNLWQYFYIDEFQDISKIQFAILQAMCTDASKLLCIGDDDQCIYEWRGACPSILQNICGYYDLQRFVLSTNYRCRSEIVKLAAVGIKQNVSRSEKGMQPYKQGGNVRIINTGTSLLDISQRAMEYIDFICTEKGAKPHEIAVLGRNNVHMALIGNLLLRKKYFVNANEGTKLSKLSIFKDIKAALIIAEGTTSSELVKSVLWKLCPYLGVANGNAVAKFMQDTNCTVKQCLSYLLFHCWGVGVDNSGLNVPMRVEARIDQKMGAVSGPGVESLRNLSEALSEDDLNKRIHKVLGLYVDGISFMYKSKDRSRFLTSCATYFEQIVDTGGLEQAKALIRLTEQTEQSAMVAPIGVGKITLSTMHGAKGREWKYVLLLAEDNLCFPSFDGINEMLARGVKELDISDSIDEGRRLNYVAMTRAEQELVIFAPVDNLSIYCLEALSILDRGDCSHNSHIVSMAKSNQLPGYVQKEIDTKLKTKSSPFYYNEPWEPQDWQYPEPSKPDDESAEAGDKEGAKQGSSGDTQVSGGETYTAERLAEKMPEDTWGDTGDSEDYR